MGYPNHFPLSGGYFEQPWLMMVELQVTNETIEEYKHLQDANTARQVGT